MYDLQQSIIRILNPQGITVGTGFIIADNLAVTCAHVVQAAGSNCDQPIQIQFFTVESEQTAQVLSIGWSPSDANDIAYLYFDRLPDQSIPVILGSANKCDEHSYRAFGFARFAGYDNRWARGNLAGVVPIQDKHKRPMLQLNGDEIRIGMSGSPILDTKTNRVVGMVSEYKDDDYTRIAWATTADTLLELANTLVISFPNLRLWPETYGPEELEAYLQYLIAANEKLTLPDNRQVFLERVYVSLRADEMNAAEREAEHELYLQDVTMLKKLAAESATDKYSEFNAMRKAVVRHPRMLMLQARNWARLFGQREQGSLSLAEVERQHRYVVVLGDPGSGKTTLGKWLVLQFARALLQGRVRVQVRADSVQPGAHADRMIDLGPPRLPIFIRIADYARIRWDKELGDSELSLERFLSSHHNPKSLPLGLTPEVVEALINDFLIQGRAIVVLDGLDEVADPSQRRAVMQTIKNFIQAQPAVLTKNEWAGNRVLLTSRIVGYQFQPLTDLPHYTVEDMDETAIEAFCRAWMIHVADVEESKEQAQKLKDAIFDHAHPSVRTLAGNPLLLTILAQVYWTSTSHSLPTRRVSLFDAATQALYDQRRDFWRRFGISSQRLVVALGAVATHIQANEGAGFIEEGVVRAQLIAVLHDWEQVEAVLEAARDVSGFLVARGEGVYGFLHRAVQEYFAAKYLAYDPTCVVSNLASRVLDSTWREPITLAVGVVSQPRYPDSLHYLTKVFDTLLDTPDPAGDFLPRRELLVVAACTECERVPLRAYRRIAERLLISHMRNVEKGRSAVLIAYIQRAFITLREIDTEAQTEAVLCEAVEGPNSKYRYAAIDIINEIEWDSIPVARALVKAWLSYADPATLLLTTLDEMIKRNPSCFHSDFLPIRQAVESNPLLWDAIKADQRWKAIVRVLYLPLGAYFKPDRINRDSPLTPDLLTIILESPSPNQFEDFRQRLILIASQPGTAKARDAALALSILDDASWITACIQNADSQGSQLYPIAGCLFLALAVELALDRNLVFTQALEKGLDQATKTIPALYQACQHLIQQNHAFGNIRAKVSELEALGIEAIVRTQTLIQKLILDSSLVDTQSQNLASKLVDDLNQALSYAGARTNVLMMAQHPWIVSTFLKTLNTISDFANNYNQNLKIIRDTIRNTDRARIRARKRLANYVAELVRSCNRASALAFALGTSIPLDVSLSIEIALEREQELVKIYNYASDPSVTQDLILVRDLIQTLESLPTNLQHNLSEVLYASPVNTRVRALALALNLALPLDRDLTKKLFRDLTRLSNTYITQAQDFEIEFARVIAHAQDLASDLELSLNLEISSEITSNLSFTSELNSAFELIQAREPLREQHRILSNTQSHLNSHIGQLHKALTQAFSRAKSLQQHFERSLSRDQELSLELDLTHIRHFDLTVDPNFISELTHINTLINEIGRSIQRAQDLLAGDRDSLLKLDESLVLLENIQKTLTISIPIARVFSIFIEAYNKRWQDKGEIKTSTASIKVSVLKSDTLPILIADLNSSNDAYRENAQKILVTRHISSKIGKTTIEQIARSADKYKDNTIMYTQLLWTLEEVDYDTPLWIAKWIEDAKTYPTKQETLIILRSLHHGTPKTCETILNALPNTCRSVNIELLNALSWLIRLKQVPKRILSLALERLLTWISNEREPDIRTRIIEVLGYWQEDFDNVSKVLIAQIHNPLIDSDLPALYMALASLAVRQPNLTESAWEILIIAAKSQLDAAAALVRLSIGKDRREIPNHRQKNRVSTRLLKKLHKILPDASYCLSALLKAGIDDNIWDEEYHAILVSMIQTHLERYTELLPLLATQFTLSLSKPDWSFRRFILAVIAACTEVMPLAVQQAFSGNLETLLVKAATDTESYNSRRFAITALGYLRTVTPAIVSALLSGCKDTEEVQHDTIVAASHFQSFEGNPLPTLIAELTAESVSSSYAVALLLGTVGASMAGEVAGLRDQIIEALVDALKNPLSEREVFISGQSKGKLKDTIYTALLQAAGWRG